jgi:putative ABC transport system substrate-binding protein
MRRRDFITLLGGAAAACPLAARAQQPKLPVVGYLDVGPPAASASRVHALLQGLRDLGYTEGKNIAIEYRWANDVDHLPRFAEELVRAHSDVIFAPASTQVEAARGATGTIPIVFANHADPVGTGDVASLAHPGGNVTGMSMLLTELVAKELEILTEAIPQATRIGVLWNPTTPSHQLALKAIATGGEKLKVELVAAAAPTPDDFDRAFATLVQQGATAMLVVGSPLFNSQRMSLAQFEVKHHLPTMVATRDEVEAGALMSYGADIEDLYRRAALYIDKILKGAKPADLPVEQASKYQLVINLKTAKSLDLTVPPTMLTLADEVIE